jgi:hypothetical protein
VQISLPTTIVFSLRLRKKSLSYIFFHPLLPQNLLFS